MSLPVFQATIVNQAGDIIPSPVITVIDEVTGLPASLFSDRNGTVPLGTNGVFTGGTDGFAQFFTASGNYRVKAELASAGFEQTWDFVALVGDSAFYEVGTGASQVPLNSDLPTFGTAAEADVQTSPTDTTEDALMAVGAFGLGSDAIITSNLNTSIIAGNYYIGVSATGQPDSGGFAHIRVIKFQTSVTQISTNYLNGSMEERHSNDSGSTWAAWKPVYTGANYQPLDLGGIGCSALARNFSGSTVNIGDTIAGELLFAAKINASSVISADVNYTSGTVWRNMGRTVLNGEYTVFTRVS